jgi:hypothetical protein
VVRQRLQIWVMIMYLLLQEFKEQQMLKPISDLTVVI